MKNTTGLYKHQRDNQEMSDVDSQTAHDALTLVLRLAAEQDDSHSPETLEVLERWKPALDAVLAGISREEAIACVVSDTQSPTLAEVFHWLDNNTTFYNVDADWPVDTHNVPVLAQVSDRIWYHATDDIESYPFSEVIKRALKSIAAPQVPATARPGLETTGATPAGAAPNAATDAALIKGSPKHSDDMPRSVAAPECVVVPLSTIQHLIEYWNGNANERAMKDALEHIIWELGTLAAAPTEKP